jgi:hypothetical protein
MGVAALNHEPPPSLRDTSPVNGGGEGCASTSVLVIPDAMQRETLLRRPGTVVRPRSGRREDASTLAPGSLSTESSVMISKFRVLFSHHILEASDGGSRSYSGGDD